MGEAVIIDGDIEVRIPGISGRQIKIGFAAPADVKIVREELLNNDNDEGVE